MRPSSSFPQGRGIALVSILILLAVVAGIVGSSTLFVQQRVASSALRDNELKGRYAAQAGISRALEELRSDGNWEPDTFSEEIAPELGFEVEVVNNRAGTSPRSAPDGSEVAPRHVWLRSVGIVRGERVRGRFGQATTQAVQPLPQFDHAVHAMAPLVMNSWRDNVVDSYDGVFTNYQPLGSRPNRVSANVRLEGGGLADNVTVDGNIVVPDADLDCVVNGVVTGVKVVDATAYPRLIFRAPAALETAPIGACPADGFIPPGRYGSLPFGTTPIEFGEGDYYFTDVDAYRRPDITIAGPGPTTIYVERGFHPGVRMNVGGDPRQLRIFFIDTGATNSFQPEVNSVVCCVVAGSALRFSLTENDEFYGAVICDTFAYTQTGSKIHYDESLKDVPLEAATEWVLVNEGEQ